MTECISGKRVYDSHDAAMRHARGMTGKQRVILRVYRCQHCSHWHVTGEPMTENLKMAKYRALKGGHEE